MAWYDLTPTLAAGAASAANATASAASAAASAGLSAVVPGIWTVIPGAKASSSGASAGLDAIAGHSDRIGDAEFLDRSKECLLVDQVILSQQDMYGFVHVAHRSPHSGSHWPDHGPLSST